MGGNISLKTILYGLFCNFGMLVVLGTAGFNVDLSIVIATIVPGYIASKYSPRFEYQNMVALGVVLMAVDAPIQLFEIYSGTEQISFLDTFSAILILGFVQIGLLCFGGWLRRKRNFRDNKSLN